MIYLIYVVVVGSFYDGFYFENRDVRRSATNCGICVESMSNICRDYVERMSNVCQN